MWFDLTARSGYPLARGCSTSLIVAAALVLFGCGSGRKPARAVVPSHWNQLEVSTGRRPPARSYTGMVFDKDRAKVIIFGGAASGGTLADLWEWDSGTATWADRTPAPLPVSWPARRVVPAVAYDEHRKRLVLFGGYLGDRDSGGRPYGDTWEWNPATGDWTDVTPPSGAPTPSPRLAAASVYDEGRRRVFLWGGFDDMGNRPLESWEWDGEARTWIDRSPSPLPLSWPAGRDGHNMAYDLSTGRILLFGGFDGDYFADLWAWDGRTASWASLTPAPLPQRWPGARHSSVMGFDRTRELLVLFGGYGGAGRSDLWQWDVDSAEWADRTARTMNERWPSALYGSTMVWDDRRELLLLYGGEAPGVARSESLWAWDGS